LWAANRAIEPYILKIILDIIEKYSLAQQNLLSQLKNPIIAYISLRIFINIASRIHDYLCMKVMPHFNKNIIMRMTKYLQKHSHAYFQNHFGGSLVSKISIIADTSERIVDESIYNFILPIFSLCLITFTMWSVRPILALLLIVWIFIFIGVSYYLSFRIHVISEQLSEKHTTLIGKMIDSITNILAVRLFARRKYEIKYLEETASAKMAKIEELRWNDLKRSAIMDIMANVLIVMLMYYLINERQKGYLSIGDFALVLTLTLSIIDIVWDISQHYMRFVENIGKCSQALKTILIPHAIKDAPNAYPLAVKEGEIEFRNVCYAPEKERAIFVNLSIKIKGHEKVGIVGRSGSGKTTFLNLLVRLMDVDEGYILIDGQDIREVTQDSLHQNISFIPQEPMLFHRTILENIKYGNLQASEEDVKEAAKRAYVDGFIQSLSKGYDTVIGERGTTLSGGQRQRLAIARSVLKNTKILILDEATSALDSETEHYIQENLKNLMHDKTVLVVAHRLATLLQMDRIIVLDEGKVVEEGTHHSLLLKKGYYAKLWDMQLDKFLVA
jgi:ATP-binding cassette subfamily B protein